MSRVITILAMTAVAGGLAACSENPGGPVAPEPAVLSKVAGDGQTATVKSPVAVSPVVRVTDAQDNPVPGVTVTFSATAGGGSVTGGVAISDSLGLATVGAWVLGTAAGTNTLTAVIDSLAVAFTATGTAGPATHAVRISDSLLVGTVGLALPVRPTVRVVDAHDNPVSGVTVTFAVTSGGGSVTGDSVVSDVLGRATVGAWVLGTSTGPNTLTASPAALPPLTFSATGRSGPAVAMVKLAGDGQTGNVSAAVDTLPAVMVRDAYGNPAEGTVVTFTVASGGGAIAEATRTTDTTGVARIGAWTLGPAPGPNTLTAEVEIAGLPAVTFTAFAVDRCTEAAPYAFGATVDGTLSASDCRLPSGEFTDLYSAAAAAPAGIRFEMSSPDFSSHVSLFDVDGEVVATTPYWCYGDYCLGTNSVRVLIGAGDYIVGAGGFRYDSRDEPQGGVVGPYTFRSSFFPEDVTGCGEVFIARGITTAQRIDTTDCLATLGSRDYYYDRFTMQLTGGRTYTISMSSTEFDTYLELRLGPWGNVVAANDDFGGSSDSRITFTPTVDGLYVLQPGTYRHGTTGTYTLTVQ